MEKYYRRIEEGKRRRYVKLTFIEKIRIAEKMRRELESFGKCREATDTEMRLEYK